MTVLHEKKLLDEHDPGLYLVLAEFILQLFISLVVFKQNSSFNKWAGNLLMASTFLAKLAQDNCLPPLPSIFYRFIIIGGASVTTLSYRITCVFLVPTCAVFYYLQYVYLVLYMEMDNEMEPMRINGVVSSDKVSLDRSNIQELGDVLSGTELHTLIALNIIIFVLAALAALLMDILKRNAFVHGRNTQENQKGTKHLLEAIKSGVILWPLKQKKGSVPLEINANMKKFQELFQKSVQEPEDALKFLLEEE